MDKSKLFTTYNKARKAARQGKLDPKAVNAALSVLQSSTARPYHTTTHGCDCPARTYNPGKACKHMIAEMIKVRAEPKPTTPAVEINEITGLPYTAEPAAQPETVFSRNAQTGHFYTCEILPAGYNIHVFYSESDGTAWIASAQHGTITHPRNSRGKFNHRIDHDLR